MEILSLQLLNFRNFTSKKIIFDKDLSIVIGPNGSGKSNILEAISLLSGIRSSRVQTDMDLVKFGKSEARIVGRVREGENEKSLVINLQIFDPSTNSGQARVKKSYFVDDYKKRLGDFFNNLSIVVFHPQDLDLVDGSPALRRHHLDGLLVSIDRQYWRDLSGYNKIISRRNKILSRILEGKSNKSELDFWDGRLLEHSRYISQKREEFFEFLNFVEKTMPISDLVDLNWKLAPSTIDKEKLFRNRERDIAAGVTLSGPHRDDFRFLFKNRDLAYFGSRGEQRMAVLALKIAELEYFRTKNGTRPILALDDIFSELDWNHREAVLSVIEKQQTIITAAEKESVPKNLMKKAGIIGL